MLARERVLPHLSYQPEESTGTPSTGRRDELALLYHQPTSDVGCESESRRRRTLNHSCELM